MVFVVLALVLEEVFVVEAAVVEHAVLSHALEVIGVVVEFFYTTLLCITSKSVPLHGKLISLVSLYSVITDFISRATTS